MFYSKLKIKPKVKRTKGTRYENENIVSHANLTNVSVNVWGWMAFDLGLHLFRIYLQISIHLSTHRY